MGILTSIQRCRNAWKKPVIITKAPKIIGKSACGEWLRLHKAERAATTTRPSACQSPADLTGAGQMQEEGADLRGQHGDSLDPGLRAVHSSAEPRRPARRVWEDKLAPQIIRSHLFMLVSFHLCFITLPSQSKGEKSQTRVLPPAALCSWEDNAGKRKQPHFTLKLQTPPGYQTEN